MADSNVSVPMATPTIGAILGTIVATAVAPHVGADPVLQTAAQAGITALFTALAHWMHSKLGTPE